MQQHMPRQPEPEYMDEAAEADAYALSDFSEVNQAFVERLLELVPTAEALDVIDLGTGPGDIPVRLCLARPGWHVVAVDASAAMLSIAGKAAQEADLIDLPTGQAGRIELVQADARETGLPPHSFDVLFSNSILHHINDTAAFWKELKRLAKPGATMFLRDLARPATATAARKIVDTYGQVGPELMREEFYRSLLSSYTPEEVCTQLAEAKLDCLEVKMVTDRHMDIFGTLP